MVVIAEIFKKTLNFQEDLQLLRKHMKLCGKEMVTASRILTVSPLKKEKKKNPFHLEFIKT